MGRVSACPCSLDACALTDDFAAGLAADRVYDSVNELAGYMDLLPCVSFQVSLLLPTSYLKQRLRGFLAIQQDILSVTVLLNTCDTHSFICAWLLSRHQLTRTYFSDAWGHARPGASDRPASVLAQLGLGDDTNAFPPFREALSVSPMDMNVGDDLILADSSAGTGSLATICSSFTWTAALAA